MLFFLSRPHIVSFRQLISRLEKLLYGCPVGGDRKAFERSVVEWVKDTLVKKCPDCGEVGVLIMNRNGRRTIFNARILTGVWDHKTTAPLSALWWSRLSWLQCDA